MLVEMLKNCLKMDHNSLKKIWRKYTSAPTLSTRAVDSVYTPWLKIFINDKWKNYLAEKA